MDISGNLDVSGNVLIDGSLNVVGYAYFQKNVDISGNLDVSGNSTLAGNVGIGTTPSYVFALDVSGSLNVGPLGTPSSGLVFQDGTFQNTAATSNVYNFGQNLQPFTSLNSYPIIDPSFILANLICLNSSVTSQYMIACANVAAADARIAMSSNYGDTWFDITSRVTTATTSQVAAAALDETGQHITIADYQNLGIYVSDNYGQTFATKSQGSVSRLTDLVMSYSGQYQLAVGEWGGPVSTGSGIISTDYGNNWNEINIPGSATFDASSGVCAMSGTGQYQAICGPLGPGLYYSKNSGVDFSNILQNFPALDIPYNGVAFSYSGEYITVAPATAPGGVLVSNYFGDISNNINTWTYKPLGGIVITSLSISNTGQYQLAIPSPNSGATGFFISTNFGGDWTRVYTDKGFFSYIWQGVQTNTSSVSSSGQRLICFDNTANLAYISKSPPAQITWALDASNNIVNNYLYSSVGIGKTAGVGYTLDVSGNVNIDGSANITDNLTVDGSLNVLGYVSFANDILVNNLTVGKGGGNTTGNTVLGYQALTNNTSGTNNTAIGYQAGNSGIAVGNTNCTFLGSSTGNSTTTSRDKSTAIGNSAVITTANQIVLGTNTEGVYIPGGYLKIGSVNAYNPSSGYALYVDGSANFTHGINAASVNTISDYRIKENVTKLNDTFVVDNLNPVTYTNTITLKQDVGFIAHELQEVYPFLVNGLKDGEHFQSVNYIGLIGILTKEIQEIKERVKILEEK